MTLTVTFTDDPARVLQEAEEFLAADPVRNNIMFTLLNGRVTSPEPGRYWLARRSSDSLSLAGEGQGEGEAAHPDNPRSTQASDSQTPAERPDGKVCGIVFNSPLAYPPLEICADREVVEAMVRFIADSGVEITGVSGAVETAAIFAGQWTEAKNCAAVPTRGTRLYEAIEVRIDVTRGLVPRSPSLPAVEDPRRVGRESWREGETGVVGQSGLSLTPSAKGREALSHKGEGTGHLRLAEPADRPLLVEGLAALMENAPVKEDPEKALDRRMMSQDFWVWEVDGKAVSMAATNNAARRGVTPINAVYTPPELRGRGYATACVAALTQRILDNDDRAILYTNLANPTSNSIYRRIGYSAVEESIMYRFEG